MEKYASLCVCVWCEKCKVSNWFGDVSLMHFLCVWIMFIFHTLMCIYVCCFSHLSFSPVPSLSSYTLAPLFSPQFLLPLSYHQKYWNNIKLQTYFPNSISLYDETYSRVPFFAERRWGLVCVCVLPWNFVLEIPLFDVHFTCISNILENLMP